MGLGRNLTGPKGHTPPPAGQTPVIRNEAGPRRWLLAPVGLLLVAAAAAMTVDCAISAWCVADNCPGFFRELFEVAEPFGNGLGVILILMAWLVLDPKRRPALPRVAALSLGAGLVADLAKMCVARVRPRHFDFSGSVTDTFAGWFPLGSGGSGYQSFPSAHTATAVGLAIALAWLYPRGRWLFAMLAVLVACQRIQSGAHFPSDTLCGAAVAFLVGWACLKTERLGGWFDRRETRAGDRPTLDVLREDEDSRAA